MFKHTNLLQQTLRCHTMHQNDSQHSGLHYNTQHNVKPSTCYAQSLYTLRPYTEYCNAECYISLMLYKISIC